MLAAGKALAAAAMPLLMIVMTIRRRMARVAVMTTRCQKECLHIKMCRCSEF